MVQDRLSDLAIMSIESDMLDELNIKHIIRQFSSMKARIVYFIKEVLFKMFAFILILNNKRNDVIFIKVFMTV